MNSGQKSDDGYLSFIGDGQISFLSVSNGLKINGKNYALQNSLPALASAVAANPSGFYALANSYDASADGKYTQAPIPELDGALEGLGNTVSNLTVAVDIHRSAVGFVGINNGTISDLNLRKVNVQSTRASSNVGGMVGKNFGTLSGDHAGGVVASVDNSGTGGLAGDNAGLITRSSASAKVSGGRRADTGGLVGGNSQAGTIIESFASGVVKQTDGFATVGGLVGNSQAESIVNSYATGSVSGKRAWVGGFVGNDIGGAQQSYSTGAVDSGDNGKLGGFAGVEGAPLTDCYWDIDTSGTNQGTGFGNVDGLTGLTDDQLKSGLPPGFDPAVWAQDPKINNGYPYLIANPPPK